MASSHTELYPKNKDTLKAMLVEKQTNSSHSHFPTHSVTFLSQKNRP